MQPFLSVAKSRMLLVVVPTACLQLDMGAVRLVMSRVWAGSSLTWEAVRLVMSRV
jgi:hypothetical protein